MKLFEILCPSDPDILNEVAVTSSWIDDLEMEDSDVIMTLLTGRQYRIHNFPDSLYDMWTEADSPGRFWHRFVTRRYLVTREN